MRCRLSGSAHFFYYLAINQIFVNDTLLFTMPREAKLIFKESPAPIISSTTANINCQTSNLGLLGTLEIDERVKNWSTIEAANPVSIIYVIKIFIINVL